jgi:lipopolysaccharide transport system permease protein
MQVKKYKPNNTKISLITILKEMFSDLRSARDLAWRLTIRDFKGQYRQSFLGAFWAFITPLMSAVVWIFLNASGAVKMADAGIPYPAYVFSGTMLWSILTESVNMPLKQTTAAKSIMNKINFPKEALLMAGIYKLLGNTAIKIVLIIVTLSMFGVFPSSNLIFLPLVLFGIILFGFAIGLLATPLGMLYTDIGRALPMFMQLLMYLSPVVYFVTDHGWLSKIISMNPTTPLVVNGRNAFTGLPFESLSYFGIISACMLVLFFIGWFFYRFSIPIIVERNG